ARRQGGRSLEASARSARPRAPGALPVTLPLRRPYPPMEALSVDRIPTGPEWQYEPKWDGFRCLAFRDGEKVALQSKAGEPRERLEAFAGKYLRKHPRVRLSPAADDPRTAIRWYEKTGGALDGVIAKRRDLPYHSGDRTGMQKIKQRRTADCVVGGFRYASKG